VKDDVDVGVAVESGDGAGLKFMKRKIFTLIRFI
jgi:hypothetical protein